MTHPSYFVALLLLLGAQLLITPNVHAAQIEPTGRDTPITLNFDKSTTPAELNIWHEESGGADDSDPDKWGHNNWVCQSSSSAEYGACPTTSVWNKDGKTSLSLIFTEQRSHSTITLNLVGYHTAIVSKSGGCAGIQMGTKLVNTAETSSCSGTRGDEALLYVSIPPDELAKIPTGGIWKAELKMTLMQWVTQSGPSNKLADWNAHITLNVTDNNNQQIYLPEFGQAAPSVDLNLRPLSGSGSSQAQMSGAANIDMCLYDGYGANSSSFTVKLDDQPQGSLSRNKDDFSLYADGGDASLISNRIDYQVAMQLPNANTLKVMRGQDNVISDIASAQVRSVYLPGIPQAVLCVPTTYPEH